MPVQESSATALIRLTGLAMICLNQTDQRGEIGIIRDDKHELTISLRQPVYEDGTNDVVRYRDVVTYQQLPNEDVRVEIKAQGAPVAGYQIYQNGDFDRLSSRDPNDFRWLVSMDELHSDGALTPTSEQPYSLTKVYLPGGLFYTNQLDQKLFFEKVKKDANGVEDQREDFGRVAKTLGVRLDGDEVSFTIRIGDREETHVLPRIAGLPHIVELKNINYDPDAVFSDMPDYYKYLASPSGDQFELRPVKKDPNTGVITAQSVNQEDFCHPIVLPLESIDQL